MTLKERLIFVSSEPFLCTSDHHPAETTHFRFLGQKNTPKQPTGLLMVANVCYGVPVSPKMTTVCNRYL